MDLINTLFYLSVLLSFTAVVSKQHGCPKEIDIIVVIDQSHSITSAEYKKMLYMTEKMFETFDISDETTHLGLAIAFHDTDFIFRLSDSSQKKHAIDLVRNLEQYGDPYIRLGQALKKVQYEFSSNFSRSHSEKILLLLSGGSSRDDIIRPSRELHQNGVGVFTIGFGQFVSTSTLSNIASSPENFFVYIDGLDNERKLTNIATSIKQNSCGDCIVDLAFIVDVSTGRDRGLSEDMVDIVLSFLKVFSTSHKKTRTSIIEASKNSHILKTFDENLSFNDIKTILSEVNMNNNFYYEPAPIGLALSLAADDVFVNSRDGVKKVLIVLSSGYSSDPIDLPAKTLHDAGVNVVTFAFGNNINRINLVTIATDNSDGLFHVNEFHDFESDALDVRTRICSDCKDESILCLQMSLWGLCTRKNVRKTCPVSCGRCPRTQREQNKNLPWLSRWLDLMSGNGIQNTPLMDFK